LATIDDTVVLTSNPVPLVGDPKLSPTVPIAPSVLTSSSRTTARSQAGLKTIHESWRQNIQFHSPSDFIPAKQFIGFEGASNRPPHSLARPGNIDRKIRPLLTSLIFDFWGILKATAGCRLPYPQEVSSKQRKSESAGGRGELALLRQIRSRASRHGSAGGLRLGIGDDCALLVPRTGEELAVTTDLSIAGRHFRLDWHEPESVGHRALARGLSDLAAMGARPVAAFLSLGLPRELTFPAGRAKSWVERFLDGLLELAEAYKTPLAGGDLAESPMAVADIVLVGALPRGRALLRSGARPGHLLYVTGSLGGAAAGLACLEKLACSRDVAGSAKNRPGCPKTPRIPKKLQGVLAAHLYPQPRLKQGLWLQRRGLASAALDLSDGLSTDLAHLCNESGVAAEVDAARLPLHSAATQAQALHGGEDYELLFTAPAHARLPRSISGVPVTAIGRIVKLRHGQPVATLHTSGGAQPLEPQGWEHFT
jgi:thiamine-monophosphate kinase